MEAVILIGIPASGKSTFYQRAVDVHQAWAEAHQAYKDGEQGTLSPDEATQAREIKPKYEVADITEDYLCRHYQLDPAATEKFNSTADILTTLQANRLHGNSMALSMKLAAVLKKRGLEAERRGGVWDYAGVW